MGTFSIFIYLVMLSPPHGCPVSVGVAGYGSLFLDAHSSSLGAPGSHGSDSFLHLQCCVSGPDVPAGSDRPGLGMVVL